MLQESFLTEAALISIPLLCISLWRIGLWKLKTYHSPLLGKIEVLRKYNGEKLLTINSYAQGVSTEKKSIEKSYWYKIAKEAVDFCHKYNKKEILMLGLGANSITSLIAKMDPKLHLTIVEIDSDIIAACKDYFGLEKLPNYTLIQADAYKLFNNSPSVTKKFDVIIVDIYTGKPPYVSLESNTPTFIEKVITYLKKDGVILFNRPGNTEAARSDSRQLKEYLQTLFKNTCLFDINDSRGYRNNIISASSKKNI